MCYSVYFAEMDFLLGTRKLFADTFSELTYVPVFLSFMSVFFFCNMHYTFAGFCRIMGKQFYELLFGMLFGTIT